VRIAIVNHTHPVTGHVSALRMARFADELAKLGNTVLLITQAPAQPDDRSRQDIAASFAKIVAGSPPVLIECQLESAVLAGAARSGRLPFGLRQLVIGGCYAFTGGIFPDWRRAASALVPRIADTFQPQVVFATFGNTDTWSIAQLLAGRAGCPWVADFKDNWSAFIPRGFRKLTARRFDDMAAMTVFSEMHRLEAGRWFDHEKTVIYSGNDFGGVGDEDMLPARRPRVLISGSLYSDEHLQCVMSGFVKWRQKVDSTGRGLDAVLSYAGNEEDRFRRVAAAVPGMERQFEVLGSLKTPALHVFQKSAIANIYICHKDSLFQQKVPELLSSGRPVLSVPTDSAEARNIASVIEATFYGCEDPDAVRRGLEKALHQSDTQLNPENLKTLSWASQAQRLHALLHRTVARK
jgi:hypothetical protein